MARSQGHLESFKNADSWGRLFGSRAKLIAALNNIRVLFQDHLFEDDVACNCVVWELYNNLEIPAVSKEKRVRNTVQTIKRVCHQWLIQSLAHRT